MKNMNLFVVSLCVALSGCSWLGGGSGGTGRLTVSPVYACPSSTITVRWSGAQAGATVVGPSGVIGSGSSGTATFTASSDGSVELRSATTVRSDFFVRSTQRFTVFMSRSTCAPLSSLGGFWGIYGAGVASPDFVDSRFRATSVSATRAAIIGHLGVNVAYEGLTVPMSGPVVGTWEFASLLQGSESCFMPPYPAEAVSAFVDATCM